MPARYIFLFTLCVKFSSGRIREDAAATTPQRARLMPARARPVPFWRHGLRVECLTSLRSFCARVPWRALAW